MSLAFALGQRAWNSADAAATNYVIAGLPFRPRLLLFVINGQQSAIAAASETLSHRSSIGFCASTSDRRCMGAIDTDAAPTMDCGVIYRADAVCATVTAAGVVDGLLDVGAINADGFTLTVDDAAPVNLTVHWYAWGGDDLVNVATLDIAEPAATGTQAYTPGFRPDVVFFVGSQIAAAAPAAAGNDAGIMFGVATGTGAADAWHLWTNQDDASTASDTDRYLRTGECLGMCVVAGGNPDARAALTAVSATQFTVNWIARAVTGRRYFACAVQGGRWAAGSTVINGGVGTKALARSVPFPPLGAIVATHGTTEQAAGTSTTEAVLSIGGCSTPTTRQVMAARSENATASSNAEINLAIAYDAVAIVPSTSGGVEAAIDVDAIDAGGYTFVVDAGSPNLILGWIAFQAKRLPTLFNLYLSPTGS